MRRRVLLLGVLVAGLMSGGCFEQRNGSSTFTEEVWTHGRNLEMDVTRRTPQEQAAMVKRIAADFPGARVRLWTLPSNRAEIYWRRPHTALGITCRTLLTPVAVATDVVCLPLLVVAYLITNDPVPLAGAIP